MLLSIDMDAFLNVVVYVLAFLSVYVQIFFFVTFLSNRKKISNTNNAIEIKNFPSVTAIVPCWNEENTIEKTIHSILDLDYPKEKLNMILVDDGSTDNTWEILQKFKEYSNIKILKKKNGGKHSALNYALEFTTTEMVVSIDADTTLEKNALKLIISYFEKDPKLSAVGGSVLIRSPKSFAQQAQSAEYQMFSFTKKMLGFIGGVLVMPGAFSVYKTKDIKKIGGWRKGNNLEDLELTYRMHTNGYAIMHCHEAKAFTSGPQSIQALFKQRLRWGYGFITNTIDYRSAVFNSKLKGFGVFTLPMCIVAYFVIVALFGISWYRIFLMLYDKFLIWKLVGLEAVFQGFSFNWFYTNTKAIAFIGILVLFFFVTNIILGRFISNVKDKNFHRIIYFFVLYSVIEPLWILRSIWNSIRSNTPSWR